jgi:hypothetical protein
MLVEEGEEIAKVVVAIEEGRRTQWKGSFLFSCESECPPSPSVVFVFSCISWTVLSSVLLSACSSCPLPVCFSTTSSASEAFAHVISSFPCSALRPLLLHSHSHVQASVAAAYPALVAASSADSAAPSCLGTFVAALASYAAIVSSGVLLALLLIGAVALSGAQSR